MNISVSHYQKHTDKRLFEHLHPVLQNVYKTRNIHTLEELDYDLKKLLNFDRLKNIHEAAALFGQAIMNQQKILVVGDFDTDGATSTALAVKVLKTFGAKYVNYLVPNRFEYGYGLTPEIVSIAQKTHKPNLIVTVDNGISSTQGVLKARTLGMEVLVTDHHLPPEILPAATAIVNPQQLGDTFPSKHLAGVGVIFYVLLAVRNYLKTKAWFHTQSITYPKMNSFLDLVALGTIADMVPLDFNNRLLVHHGLKLIQTGKACNGIKALAEISHCKLASCTTKDLSFRMAPKLNAAGRIQDMSIGIECLLSDNLTQGLFCAQQLNELNQQRQILESTMQQKAFSILDDLSLSSKKVYSICLFDPSWHQGITGLVAGRIKEQLGKPTVVFAPSTNPDELKGSARSIPGIHIRDTLATIASKYPELLSRFGGHALAAGLTLHKRNYSQFKNILESIIQENTNTSHNMTALDGHLDEKYLSLEVAYVLEHAGPWGQGFPEPSFSGVFQILDQSLVGEKHLQLILRLNTSQKSFKAIFFNVNLKEWPNRRAHSARIIYRLTINAWKERKSLQLNILKILEHFDNNV